MANLKHHRPGVGKLWPPPTHFVWLPHTDILICLHIIYWLLPSYKGGVEYLWERSYVASWLIKLKIFTILPFKEKFADYIYIYSHTRFFMSWTLSHQYLLTSLPLSHSVLQPSQVPGWGLHSPSSPMLPSLEMFFSPTSGKVLCWLQETTEMNLTSLREKLNSVVPLTKNFVSRTNIWYHQDQGSNHVNKIWFLSFHCCVLPLCWLQPQVDFPLVLQKGFKDISKLWGSRSPRKLYLLVPVGLYVHTWTHHPRQELG